MPEAHSVGFVLGTGRCGSTLVHDVLSRHDGVGTLSNLEDLTQRRIVPGAVQSRLLRWVPPAMQQKGRVRVAPSEGYRILERAVSPVLVTPFRDLVAADATPWLAERSRSFFLGRAERLGCPVFLHKFTGWPRAGFLAAALPGSRFVNVVRDGRAVANSWLQMEWWLGYGGPERWQFGPLPHAYREEWEQSGRSFVALAGIGWKLLMDAFEQARAGASPGSWLDVRYEEVVADPAGQLRRMLDFLGLAWDPRFERQVGRYRFGRERTAAYARDLGADQVAALTESLREHLERWGYRA